MNFKIHENSLFVLVGKSKFIVEVADDNSERAQGLSNRGKLNENAGMLFVFDRPERYGFWMKNMNFPLDIVWIGSDKTVIDIDANVRPESFPTMFTPDRPSQYVLEINGGLGEKLSLSVGDRVDFEIAP